MKLKRNKKGFTLVEVMIVVVIIGLLAAIGIPAILGAMNSASERAMQRNITDVEKAKAQMTLPSGTVTGAMDADPEAGWTADHTAGVLEILKIEAASDLDVGNNVMALGDWTTRASYSVPAE